MFAADRLLPSIVTRRPSDMSTPGALLAMSDTDTLDV